MNKIFKFQSHIGAIRINDERGEEKAGYNDFNPTLVQLEYTCLVEVCAVHKNFNPTLVQLE